MEQITDLITNGISGPAPWEKPTGWSLFFLPEPAPLKSEDKEPLTKGEKTRQAILLAAEKVIGQRGINRANISEITREASVAQGTFYVHFKSKSDLIEGFVRYINHEMRREIQRAVSGTRDRRDAERVGILTFLEFLRRHRQIYRVVPECEMISREVSQWYYQTLSGDISKAWSRALNGGRSVPSARPSWVGPSWDLSISSVSRRSSGTRNPTPENNRQLFQDMIECILFGIRIAEI